MADEPTPKGYTSKTDVENYLMQTIASTFDTQLNKWIIAVENFIDKYTGRTFIADAEDAETTQYYDGNGHSELRIKECVSVITLKINDSEVDATDYLLYPANETPKTKIRLKNRYFCRGDQNIEVTGRFGYAEAVPQDISLVATMLVAGITSFASPRAVKSESIGPYSVTYDDINNLLDQKALDILNFYKRYSF